MLPRQIAALRILLLLLSLVTLFHLLILTGFIPYEITWGGRLKNVQEMVVFESISLLVNAFLILLLLLKGKYLHMPISPQWQNRFLWGFVLLFLLNTLGNLAAKTTFEKSFAVVTLLFALLIAYLLQQKKNLLH